MRLAWLLYVELTTLLKASQLAKVIILIILLYSINYYIAFSIIKLLRQCVYTTSRNCSLKPITSTARIIWLSVFICSMLNYFTKCNWINKPSDLFLTWDAEYLIINDVPGNKMTTRLKNNPDWDDKQFSPKCCAFCNAFLLFKKWKLN